MWKPEAMRVDKGTKGVIPDLGKSHGLLRSFDDKEEVEMNFPLNGSLTHKSYKDRWESLKKSGVATGEDPPLAASSHAAQPQVSFSLRSLFLKLHLRCSLTLSLAHNGIDTRLHSIRRRQLCAFW